jgi:lysyl-tRNA synthetase class 2
VSSKDDFIKNRIDKQLNVEKLERDKKLLYIDEIKRAGYGKHAKTAGRLISRRNLGKIAFGFIQRNGKKLQIVIKSECKDFLLWKNELRLGDIVFVEGATFETKAGEFSILADRLQLLSCCLYPFPDKFKGISDTELLLRKPFLTGLTGNNYLKRVQMRSCVLNTMRSFFIKRDFLEVETPILDTHYGGGYARPFVTRNHVHETDLMMRISPEINLKKIMVGGVEKIFEIGKSFRNEGLDRKHNFEFTTLEAYSAYSNYIENSYLIEELIKELCKQLLQIGIGDEAYLSKIMKEEWKRVFVYDELSSVLQVKIDENSQPEELIELCQRYQIEVSRKYDNSGKLIEKLYSELLEKKSKAPCFFFDFPVETTPLADHVDDKEGIAQRWDLVINTLEVSTGYTELVDALEQKKRLKSQSNAINRPDEAVQYDESFVDAISYAIPPTGGIGIGVDRVLMALLNCSIRDTLLIPNVDNL